MSEENKRRKVKVRCTWDVMIDVPAEWNQHDIEFYVEDNGCPGTGAVGRELESAMEVVLTKMQGVCLHSDDNNYCWACGYDDARGAGHGENKVLEIEGML